MLPQRLSPAQPRFVFVDGLRGLAALAIVLFHLNRYEPDPHMALANVHWAFEEVLFRIRGGVQILLVISGFVIAYTLRNVWVTPREMFSFIARRLVRLVPPYWITLAIVIIDDATSRIFGIDSPPFEGELSLSRLSAHMTFLQDVFGHEALSAGIWTICIEMQFYVIAIIGWGIAQRMFARPVASEPRPSAFSLLVVFAPFAFLSLFYWRTLESTDDWIIHFAWMFFIGMATWWTLDGTFPTQCYAAIVAIAVGELYFDDEWRFENSIALATAASIYVAGQRKKLDQWLNWGWLQYLGRISYSLYLIHFPVCHLLTSAGWKLYGDAPTSVQAVLILLVALSASLVAAHLLYITVEAPSARFAAKMKQSYSSPVGKLEKII